MLSKTETTYLNEEGYAMHEITINLFGLTIYKLIEKTKEISILNKFESIKSNKKVGFKINNNEN